MKYIMKSIFVHICYNRFREYRLVFIFIWYEIQLNFFRRGIAPQRNCINLLKNVLNHFVCIKLNFFLTIILYLISSLVDIIGIKPALGNHESIFKKVGEIQSVPNF